MELLQQDRQLLDRQKSDFALIVDCSDCAGAGFSMTSSATSCDVTSFSPHPPPPSSLPLIKASGGESDVTLTSCNGRCAAVEEKERLLMQHHQVLLQQQLKQQQKKTRPRSATGQMERDGRLLRQDSEPLHLLRNNVQRTVKARLDHSPPAACSSPLTPPTRKKSIVSEVFTHILPAKFASLSSVLSSPKSSFRAGRSFRTHHHATPSSVYSAVATPSLKMSKTGKLSQSQPQISSFSSSPGGATLETLGSESGLGLDQAAMETSFTLQFQQQPLSSVTEGNSSYCISQETVANCAGSDDTTGTGSDHNHSSASIKVMAVYMAKNEETDL